MARHWVAPMANRRRLTATPRGPEETTGVGGRYVVRDVGDYAVEAIEEIDRLRSLRAQAESLVLQAALLNREPTEVQMQSFTLCCLRLRELLRALEGELEGARAMVSLAETSVADTLAG